jgi:hypothetical protein
MPQAIRISQPWPARPVGYAVSASEAKQSMEAAEKETKQSMEAAKKNGLLRRIRLRPKAGFGGQECSSQ